MPKLNSSFTLVALAAFFNIATLGFFFFAFSNLPPIVPLFYGLPQGEDQLVPKSFLSIPPILSLGILAINMFLSKFINDTFLKKALINAIFITTLLSTITVIKIILLVSSL